MISITIQEGLKKKSKTIKVADKPLLKIGRWGSNILLVDPSVSKEHAEICKRGTSYFISDLGSKNGTFLNKNPIPEMKETQLQQNDVVAIGVFQLTFDFHSNQENVPSADSEEATMDEAASAPKSNEHQVTMTDPSQDDEEASFYRDPKVIELKADTHKKLLDLIDLRRLDLNKIDDEQLREQCRSLVAPLIKKLGDQLPANIDREIFIKDILDEALALGPLEDLMADPDVSEIMVNSYDQIYVEKKGRITLSPKIFSGNQSLMGVISRIVAPIGRRIDESSPMVDARLKDGSRVNVVIPPLALKGASITIRKFAKVPLTMENLVQFNTLSRGMATFLETAVQHKKNVVISGGTGSGKTTTLNLISAYIPQGERIVTIEDAAELQLPQEHVVSLETRPPNIEGKGEINIRNLVRNALRMRPDRIIVGECRGGEALDMLQAMNTGHDGSLTTGHANTPQDMLSRLETMVLMAGQDLPIRAIREQIASAIHLIVQQTRFSCGTRKITHITEVAGLEDDKIVLQNIFYFKQEGRDSSGKTKGRFISTGWIPDFYKDIQERGLDVDTSIFYN